MDEPAEPASFTCPVCGRTTYHPRDVEERYCANCSWWTGDPVLANIEHEDL
jgi:ribosomal protein L37E